MPVGRFLLFTAIGSFIWTGGLAIAGYVLENGYEAVSHLIDPLSTAIVLGFVALYVWRVIRWRPDA